MASARNPSRVVFVTCLVTVAVAVAAGAVAVTRVRRQGSSTRVPAAAGLATRASGSFRVTMKITFSATGQASGLEDGADATGLVDMTHDASDITSGPIATSGTATTPQSERQISIGADTWMSRSPASPPIGPQPSWVHVLRHGATPPRPGFAGLDPIALLDQLKRTSMLHLVGHEVVRDTATDHYEVRVPASSSSPPLSGTGEEVWVSDDHLVRRLKSTVHVEQPGGAAAPAGQLQESVTEFYDFGVGVDIRPPPADQTLELSFPSPAPSPTSPPPELPRARVTGSSPIQVRPVQSVRDGDCAEQASDPPADQPAAVRGLDGSCYDLGLSLLTVTRTRAAADVGGDGRLAVRLSLDASDSAAFDQVTSAYSQRRLALVMFGRVLTAPTVQTTEVAGVVVISPVDPQTAADAIAALAG